MGIHFFQTASKSKERLVRKLRVGSLCSDFIISFEFG